MKKQVIKLITLLAFSSVLLSSCAVGYEGRHRDYDRYHQRGRYHDSDRHDDHYHDSHH